MFVGFIETALAEIGFKAELPPIIFVGKNSQGGIIKSDTLPDAKLLFKYEPGSIFDGRRINQLGFREREVDPVKKPGSMRVICMGDSVTAQGRPGYSQYLHERLTNQPPTPQPWEAFNMAMHGYTSLQGLTLFRMRGKALAPDIVVICYGWNDQWLSPKTDRQQMGMEMEPWAGRLFDLLREKRIFQYMIWSLNPVYHLARLESHKLYSARRHTATNAVQDPFHGFVFRVAPEEYRDTLTAFIGEVRAAGAVPLLMTEASRKLPQKWADDRQYRTIEEGNQLHDLYMNIMRTVAREQYCDLLDLAAILGGKDCDRYFAEDGVHFDFYQDEGNMQHDPPDQPGLRRIAEELDKKIRDIARRPVWQNVRPQPAAPSQTLHANLKTASGAYR
jgi:lysophospholipase L1-like esterase